MEEMVKRDPVVSILFGIAVFLIAFLIFAGHRFAVSRNPELLEIALVLTGAFAVAGMAFGLARGLRSGARRRT